MLSFNQVMVFVFSILLVVALLIPASGTLLFVAFVLPAFGLAWSIIGVTRELSANRGDGRGRIRG